MSTCRIFHEWENYIASPVYYIILYPVFCHLQPIKEWHVDVDRTVRLGKCSQLCIFFAKGSRFVHNLTTPASFILPFIALSDVQKTVDKKTGAKTRRESKEEAKK